MNAFSERWPALLTLAALVSAGDLAWKSKPPAEWTANDAKQVLTASPWSHEITATVTRRLTEEQLREGGQMGTVAGCRERKCRREGLRAGGLAEYPHRQRRR